MTLADSGAFTLAATSNRAYTTNAAGAAVALGAGVGVSLAKSDIEGGVSATVKNGAKIGTSGVKAGTVNITAKSVDAASATTLAAAGGIGGAGAGADATAIVTPGVSVTLDDAAINSTGAVTLLADAEDSAAASSRGLALAGGLAVGGSLANATLAPNVALTLKNGSSITAASLEADAKALSNGVTAAAYGASGAIFAGINATSANATDHSSAIASATGSSLSTTGALNFQAISQSSNSAVASGKAFGIVALGANLANVNTNVATRATFLDLTSVTAGSLLVNANGTVTSNAQATAGSGGIIAGAAANATTSDSSTTVASIAVDGNGSPLTVNVTGGDAKVLATHTATFVGSVDTTQASLAGKSGARLSQTVTSTVAATIGDGVTLYAANFSLDARNIAHRFFNGEGAFGLYPGQSGKSGAFSVDNAAYDVQSGSGGFLDAPAVVDASTVTLNTSASVGVSTIHLLAPTSGVSSAFIEAYNEAVVHQKAKVDSGGAISVASGNSTVAVNATATVNFAARSVVLVDIGDVQAAAWANADLDSRTAVTTYGVAGAPKGTSYINAGFNNLLNVGSNARIEASDGIEPGNGSTPSNGTVTLAAGELNPNTLASYVLNTNVDLFNNTAIPLNTTPDAQSNLASTAAIVIGTSDPAPANGTNPHYGVNAAGDITIAASQGNMSTTAKGVGKNIYLEALSKTASAISEFFGGGAVSFDITGGSTQQTGTSSLLINGLVDTGIARSKTLTLNYSTDPNCAGACLANPVPGEIGYVVSGPFAVGQTILDRIGQLRSLQAQYAADPIALAAYKSEESYLDIKLAALGLGTFNSSGTFTLNAGVTYGTVAASATQSLSQLTSDLAAFGQVASSTVFMTTITQSLDNALYAWYGKNSAGQSDPTASSYAVTTNATNALNTYKTFANYTTINGDNTSAGTSFRNTWADVTNQMNTGAATNAINDLTASNTAASTIAAQITAIINAEQALAAGGSSATATTASVNAAISTISTNQNTIVSKTADMATQITALQTATNTILSDLSTIQSAVSKYDSHGNNLDQSKINTLGQTGPNASDTGAITRISNAMVDISGVATDIKKKQ